MESSKEDFEIVRRMNGIFVGMLSDREIEALNRCVIDGLAVRSYEGGGGFMGLAKARLTPNAGYPPSD